MPSPMTSSSSSSSARRSSRVLQPRNKRVVMTPENQPAKKRVKEEPLETPLKIEIKEEEEVEENSQPGAPGLSQYEAMVQRNIAQRHKLMESFGIFKAKEELVTCLQETQQRKKAVYRGIKREKRSPEPVIRRRSLRQQRLTPDGLDLPLPSDDQVARAERSMSGPTYHQEEEEHPKPPPGPAPLLQYYHASDSTECQAMLRDIAQATTTTTTAAAAAPASTAVWGGPIASVVKRMKTMRIAEDGVVKVVPSRIFSVQFHPTVEKTLVVVGGKWGQLGILEVGRRDASSGAYCLTPHSRPINCLSVAASAPHHLHSTSYDGSLRQTDLVAGVVQEVYALDDDLRNSFLCWHSQVAPHTFLLSASLGRVIQVDTREDGGKVKEYLVHERKTVKVISGHPTSQQYFATGGNDGLVCVWDLRHHKNNKPLSCFRHARNVSGLEFSETGNTLVSTSLDNTLRFITFDGTALTVSRTINHNNHTGRWLTTFKARFVPTRDDLIYVGAMTQPRRIEVWGSDGALHHTFRGDALASVSSVVALHPHAHALVGCNSSGKVHAFM